MKIEKSYYCKYPDGTSIWFAPNAKIKPGYSSIEERKMLLPDSGKMLSKKNEKEFSDGIWLKDSTEEDWEEIEKTNTEPEE